MKRIFFLIQIIIISSQLHAQTIGLELYSLREQFKTDVPGTLALIKSWGIHEVEGGGTYGLPMEEYKKLLKKNDLQMVGISAEYDQLSTGLQAIIDEAKALGAKYIVCFWIPHNGDDFTINDVKKAAAVFNKVGKQIHDNGLIFCYHPHGFEFRPYNNETLFDYLVANTNAEHVNFEMDVFWVKHPGQEPVALLKKYPKRFKLLHLKDRKPGTEGNQNGETDVESNVVLGQGDVGIAAIMTEAKKTDVQHYFIEDESSRSVQQIPESLKFLSSLH